MKRRYFLLDQVGTIRSGERKLFHTRHGDWVYVLTPVTSTSVGIHGSWLALGAGGQVRFPFARARLLAYRVMVSCRVGSRARQDTRTQTAGGTDGTGNTNSATGPIGNPMVEGARAAVAICTRVSKLAGGSLAGNRAMQPIIQSLSCTHAPSPVHMENCKPLSGRSHENISPNFKGTDRNGNMPPRTNEGPSRRTDDLTCRLAATKLPSAS